MPRLSSPIDNIQPHYAVVVIGSGYGGGIAASRLARAGQSVCVLERGKEFLPGEYPDTELEALPEIQVNLPDQTLGLRTGLYDIRVSDDMNVLVGCGLGGTSLINANVASRPEPRVFDDVRWPQALRADVNTLAERRLRSRRNDARIKAVSRSTAAHPEDARPRSIWCRPQRPDLSAAHQRDV